VLGGPGVAGAEADCGGAGGAGLRLGERRSPCDREPLAGVGVAGLRGRLAAGDRTGGAAGEVPAAGVKMGGVSPEAGAAAATSPGAMAVAATIAEPATPSARRMATGGAASLAAIRMARHTGRRGHRFATAQARRPRPAAASVLSC
jgi:hypothetical protein